MLMFRCEMEIYIKFEYCWIHLAASPFRISKNALHTFRMTSEMIWDLYKLINNNEIFYYRCAAIFWTSFSNILWNTTPNYALFPVQLKTALKTRNLLYFPCSNWQRTNLCLPLK